MDTIIDDTISIDEIKVGDILPNRCQYCQFLLQSFERKYNQQLARGQPSARTAFEFAHCLIRSPRQPDVKLGVKLLEGLKHLRDNLCLLLDELNYHLRTMSSRRGGHHTT